METIKRPIKNAAQRLLGGDAYDQLAELYGKGLCHLEQYTLASLKNRLRLRRLHNLYSGRRCFVIANGPSLAQMNLAGLNSEITIGSNGLFLMVDQLGYFPTFYTVQDYLTAESFAKQINGIKNTTKLIAREIAHYLLPDENTIYFDLLPDSHQRYLDKHMNEDFQPKFSERLDKGAYDGCTVTYLNLQLACYLGCRQIYLIGLDHHYQLPSNVDVHKDSIITSPSDDISHFDPHYFGKGVRYYTPRVDKMERAYMVARDFAARKGVEIINATKGGALEVFRRANFEDIMRI
jgi:hypothetical protein